MKVQNFTMLELLELRVFIVSVFNSTRGFLHIETTSKDVSKLKEVLKEVEKEILDRLIGEKTEQQLELNFENQLELNFKDQDFNSTLNIFKGKKLEEK